VNLTKEAWPRIIPFALYMVFIGLEEILHFLKAKGIFYLSDQSIYFLYPVKILLVGLTLLLFRSRYSEIKLRDFLKLSHTGFCILTGFVVFVLWVNMDCSFATIGIPAGYNPTIFADKTIETCLIISRLAGAVVVVPVMEELFWRSFLIRYIVQHDFMKVPIGQFSWPSFLITTILFGLEHNLYLAGMVAGMAYNLILYYTKSIFQCILAHAVTNLALGIYVCYTGQWQFW